MQRALPCKRASHTGQVFEAWTAENNLRARDGFKLTRITEAFYNEMLNCLPPMYRSGSMGFFLSERETDSITAQFVVSGAHYYGGYVDLLNRSTWITAEKIDDLDRDAELLSCFQCGTQHVKLIVMGCSDTKRRDRHPMPAIDLYDRPMWRSLRARLAANQTASLALCSGELEIMFLSAEYGFRDVSMRITDYDRKMTQARADELCGMWRANCSGLARRFAIAEAVLFAGGSIYRRAMWKASDAWACDPEKVTETDSGGIGYQRASLGTWLAAHYPQS